MSLMVRPISFNSAKGWIAANHRHQPAITGWLFGVEIVDATGRVGVAAVGRPARMLQDGVTCEIVRVATNGAPNACSFAYGALRKAASALGYTRIVTYTRPDESGASLRAAGFRFAGVSAGGEWSRKGRPRKSAVDPGPKLRWVWYAKTPDCTCGSNNGKHAQNCELRWFNQSEHDARLNMYQAQEHQ